MKVYFFMCHLDPSAAANGVGPLGYSPKGARS